ncbi:cation:proton antiporter [Candidatus Margulisiibacteriota bacterium]
MSIDEFIKLLSNDVFFTASGILILGFIVSWMAKKIKLPRITGYLMAGIIFGPYLLKVFSESSVYQLGFIHRLALGIVALVIGSGLSFGLLKKLGWRLMIITLMESLGAFFFVFFLLYMFKMPLGAILPLAAIAAATAPAATVAIMQEYRTRGTLTETTLAVVALDDAVAIILFGLIMTFDFTHISTFGKTAFNSLSASLLEISTALIIGILLGIVANLLIKLTKDITDSVIIILGIVFLAIAVASVSHTSALLTNMFLGITLINLPGKSKEMVPSLEKLTPPIYCFFFVLAGASLNLKIFTTIGTILLIWSIVFVVGRMIGKISGAFMGSSISKSPEIIKKYLGLTLIPQAGVAIGLSLLITSASPYFEFKAIILNVTLVTVAFNEIIGPILTKYALFKAGEATVKE